ncbi:DUF547 domain-containing protein [Phormidium tenue FACHB-886]|nr:DUF547 domain-containing protein [Phormidium tenue FACHB-886]
MSALDFTPWDLLLRQYVDSQGRVDYAAWQAQPTQVLSDWLNQMAGVEIAALDVDQRLAFWLNLYNALVIDRVLQRYPIASIRPTVLGIPNWLAFFWFFVRPVYHLGKTRYSLNAIEHDTLRQDFDEPRIHFALVCAAIGCPLLRNEAYQPQSVRSQLEADASRFINNPAKVYYDAQTQTLYCSQILKWYRQDFLKVASSIPAYVQPYLSFPLPDVSSLTVRYLDYDWSLNQRISS